MKILFVCTGNICRSPMAEIIFTNICTKAGKTGVTVRGAGTGAQEGEFMTAPAHEALEKCGEGVFGPRPSTRWHESMITEYDHIICMARHHVRQIDPAGVHKHIRTLDDIAGCGDIFDPWLHPVKTYIEVCKQLQTSLPVLYNYIYDSPRKRPRRL